MQAGDAQGCPLRDGDRSESPQDGKSARLDLQVAHTLCHETGDARPAEFPGRRTKNISSRGSDVRLKAHPSNEPPRPPGSLGTNSTRAQLMPWIDVRTRSSTRSLRVNTPVVTI